MVDFQADFAGKVAVVTGGTDGLGKHLTQTLIGLGATVYFCARRVELGQALVAECGPQARFVACDLADPRQARDFITQAGQGGAIDYLVNNAAIDPRIEFAQATDADFDRLMAINLRPFFSATHAALPYLKAGRGKAIVNICTTNYMLGLSPFTLYNASKSAVVGFTRSLARELGPLGIRANVLSPGWIMTDKQLRAHVTEEDKKQLLEAQALKFLLKEADVTPATLFLLSSAARGITGQNLVVDGGKVMY
ncbi:MAG: SDR family oxidoreductase [Phycisphaeraceae bacterium]|nr:SDR family oxidoreductase [Phycisphaeraceae bacterium]